MTAAFRVEHILSAVARSEQVECLIGQGGGEVKRDRDQFGMTALAFKAGHVLHCGAAVLARELREACLMYAVAASRLVPNLSACAYRMGVPLFPANWRRQRRRMMPPPISRRASRRSSPPVSPSSRSLRSLSSRAKLPQSRN